MDSSQLGRLAAELRMRIYELVLIHNEPMDLTISDGVVRMQRGHCLQRQVSSLFSVCRQTHNECSHLLYSANSFRFNTSIIGEDKIMPMSRFMAVIGEANSTSLRQVTVVLTAVSGDQKFRPNGYIERALWNELEPLEECLDGRPQLKLWCRLGLALSCNDFTVMSADMDMTEWLNSKTKAREVLEPYMALVTQGYMGRTDPTGEALTARYLMSIVEGHKSVREEKCMEEAIDALRIA